MAKASKKIDTAQPARPGSRSVDDLATHALSMVAKRNSKPVAEFNVDLARRLCDAAAGAISETVEDVIGHMTEAGITTEMIADVYIPFAARDMGDAWCEDTMSFATVTIGTARLQSALRALGNDWHSTAYDGPHDDKEGLIIIVVRDSYHTLGAVVLAGQLRRLGLSVRLAMGPSAAEVRALFEKYTFDAALISSQETTGLDSLREIIDVIRQSAETCPPIIVGGSVLELCDDVQALTGADYVTNDPIEALEKCGLTHLLNRKPVPTKLRT